MSANEITPLAFHVTYGDNGWGNGENPWKDIYGTTAWDNRHRRTKKPSVIFSVPQFVVDGRPVEPSFKTVMPDAKKKEVRAYIEKAAQQKPLMTIVAQLEKREKGRIEGRVKIQTTDGFELSETTKVVPIVFSRETNVVPTAGWNKGVRIHGYFVARAILDPLDARRACQAEGLGFDFEVPEEIEASKIGVAFLVEDADTGKTLESRAVFLVAE